MTDEVVRETIALTNERGQTRQYETVASRLMRFRTDKPDWFIHTFVEHIDGDSVMIRADIGFYMEGGVACVLASGRAAEWRGDGTINETSAVENCETSALGRALAFLGYGSPASIASAEEVLIAQEKAKRIETEEPGSLILLQNAANQGFAALDKQWKELDVDARRACAKYMKGPKGLTAKSQKVDDGKQSAVAGQQGDGRQGSTR